MLKNNIISLLFNNYNQKHGPTPVATNPTAAASTAAVAATTHATAAADTTESFCSNSRRTRSQPKRRHNDSTQ